MRSLPERRWQRTVWRKNTVHPDYHIAIDYRFYSVPYSYIGKEVDVRLRGQVIAPGRRRRTASFGDAARCSSSSA